MNAARRLRHLPNCISALRLLGIPVLLLLAWSRHETAFTWLLVASLLSDIADGLIARLLRITSRLGAMLDSTADSLLLFAACYGAWVFHRGFVGQHWRAVVVLLAFWMLENLLALLRYGRLSSFHTYMSRVAGYALGICIGVLFVFGDHTSLLYLAVSLSVAGNLEEMWLLWLLPVWEPDVKGLAWVRRRGAVAP